MCKDKDITTEVIKDKIVFTDEIPEHVRPQILESLKEVELIRRGELPKKSARDLLAFLKDIKEEDNQRPL